MKMEEIKRAVIKKHLEGWERDLKNTSIEHFAKSGKVSGSFFMALKDMLDDYVEQLRLHNVSESCLAKCDVCGCHPNVIIRTEFGTFCQAHARHVR